MRNFKLLSILLLTSTVMFTACGSSSKKKVDDNKTEEPDKKPDRKTPIIKDATISMPTKDKATYKVSASDPDGTTLSYEIKTPPSTALEASIASDGLITFSNFGNFSADSCVIKVTDSDNLSAEATITINASADVGAGKSFNSQFYKVQNPKTGNDQITHYNSKNGEQTVIKTNVTLGRKVFVMSGHKDGDKTRYNQREYAIFLDPNANSETRTADDGAGGTYEYPFYKSNILKRFDAGNTDNESTILGSTGLNQDIKDAGLVVLDSSNSLHLNEVDTDNSYMELTAYDELADVIKGEKPEENLHAPIIVRLSDSAHTVGKMIRLIKKENGTTEGVLINYIAAHKKGAYPDDDAKRLQICDTALTCTDVSNADGHFFYMTENDTHVYMTKKGSKDIFAYDKTAKTFATVTGVEYPATFDPEHHNLSLYTEISSHAGSFSSFWNLVNARGTLSEANDAYVAINYDLDSKNPVGPGPYDAFGMTVITFKNAMVLKLNGTTGVKVYDNGDGVDNMDNPADGVVNYHISIMAVKNGNVLIEAAKFNGGDTCKDDQNCMNYKQAWLHTDGQTITKTDFDNTLVDEDYAYLVSRRVPPVVVGDHAYINKTEVIGAGRSSTKVYHVYKMPLNDATLDTNATDINQTLSGRMYFEKSAYSNAGIYDGTVIMWDYKTGDVLDLTNGNKVIGNDDITEVDKVPFSVMAKSSTDVTAGYGGLFGLSMSFGHGITPYLVSGKTNAEGTLKKVNQIHGAWIMD